MREREAKSKFCFMSLSGGYSPKLCEASECMAWGWFGADEEGYGVGQCKLVDTLPSIYPAKVTGT